MVTSFFKGLLSSFYALRFLIKNPDVAVWTIVPIVLGVGVYSAFFFFAFSLIGTLTATLTALISGLLPVFITTIASWLIVITSGIFVILLGAVTFTSVTALICSPFFELISRKTAKKINPTLKPIQSALFRTLFLELKRSFILISGSLLCFIIGLIPIFHIPAILGTSLLFAFEFYGYPSSLISNSIQTPKEYIKKNIAESLGYGLTFIIASSIPIFGAFYLPLAVVQSTLLCFDKTISSDNPNKI